MKIRRKYWQSDRYGMKFLRNPEIRRNLVILTVLASAFSIYSACLDIRFGLAAAAFAFGLVGLSVQTAYKRYRLMSDMSLEIDRILHGSSHFDLSLFSEGELSVLSSEVYKMTVRLREQADTLQKDKMYLADSLADISHQIRIPLTSMNLIASFLSEEKLRDERRIQLARELQGQLSRVEWLINTLFKISKLDTGSVQMLKEPITALEVVKKAADLVVIPMELHNQKLIVQAQKEGHFLGDLSWCTEAVGNILKNCMEHTPEGGTVTVAISENSLFTEIIIRDSGDGFDEEDISHLFERFYKGKNASENSFGIGLALSRMIIQQHDGTIRAGNSVSYHIKGIPQNHAECLGAEFVIRFYRMTV